MPRSTKMDLNLFIGKNVEIVLYRRRKAKKFYGRLTHIGDSEICLVKNGVPRWVKRPNQYRDSIQEDDNEH